MSTSENQPNSEVGGSAPVGERRSDRLCLGLFPCVGLAVFAAAVTYGLYWSTVPFYPRSWYTDTDPPRDLLRVMPSEEDAQLREVVKNQARGLHAAAALGCMGLLLSGMWAFGEIKACKNNSGIGRVLLGAVLAAALGGVGGLLGVFVYTQVRSVEFLPLMAAAVLCHITMFALCGMGVGLAVGLATGRRSLLGSAMAAGLVAGVLAAVLFHFGGSLLLPGMRTDAQVPDGSAGVHGFQDAPKGFTSFAIWMGLLAICLGIVLPLFVRHKEKRGS